MTAVQFLLFLGGGGLLTWLLQINGLTARLWALHPLFEELGNCDLCLGFWVFLAMAYTLHSQPFGLWQPWLEPFILAAISTLLSHLLRAGWKAKFGTTIL